MYYISLNEEGYELYKELLKKKWGILLWNNFLHCMLNITFLRDGEHFFNAPATSTSLQVQQWIFFHLLIPKFHMLKKWCSLL